MIWNPWRHVIRAASSENVRIHGTASADRNFQSARPRLFLQLLDECPPGRSGRCVLVEDGVHRQARELRGALDADSHQLLSFQRILDRRQWHVAPAEAGLEEFELRAEI